MPRKIKGDIRPAWTHSPQNAMPLSPHSETPRGLRFTWRPKQFILVLGLATGALVWWALREPPRVTKSSLAEALKEPLEGQSFPLTLRVQTTDHKQPVEGLAHYTLDLELQHRMDQLLRSYKPDYAAFVAMNAETGEVLSLLSYTHRPQAFGNLALKATFPAASVFKLVTATAAVDQKKAHSNTVIAFNGANHTLYRRNVTETKINRWTRYMTLREAFAKSVNTVFGKLGLFVLKPGEIEEYAERFMFNRDIPTDLPVEAGQMSLDSENQWSTVEIASGFNRDSHMSPLQGALMAASVVNDGRMMEPYIVDTFYAEKAGVYYEALPQLAAETMSPEASQELRRLMKATITNGTSRKSFSGLLRQKDYRNLEVGGKTGSLTGRNPKGKCDWFVGYALGGNQKIALAALTVNEEKWRVKSAYLARKFIEYYFDPDHLDLRGIQEVTRRK